MPCVMRRLGPLMGPLYPRIDLSIHQTITDLTFDAARWYCRLLAAAVGTPPAFKRFEN